MTEKCWHLCCPQPLKMSPSEDVFDIIIAGAGASGLSLAWYFANEDHNLKIAVIDKSFRPSDDTTWSFWDDAAILSDSIIHHQWRELALIGRDRTVKQKLDSYKYTSIRSDRYKKLVLDKISDDNRFTLIETSIKDTANVDHRPAVLTLDGIFRSKYVFKSFNNGPNPKIIPDGATYLKQHFLGWDIRCGIPVFNPDQAILMDFRVPQNDGFAFVYILPFDSTSALVELTYFSANVLPQKHYEHTLEEYLRSNWQLVPDGSRNLINHFSITRSEFGVIPMIDVIWLDTPEKGIYPVGISGGLAKASTGYTFSRIQADSRRLVSAVLNNRLPIAGSGSPWRYRYYDMLILNIIKNDPEKAAGIFLQLFEKNGFDTMLAFLDEKLTLPDEIKIMSGVPDYVDFFKSMWDTKSKIFRI